MHTGNWQHLSFDGRPNDQDFAGPGIELHHDSLSQSTARGMIGEYDPTIAGAGLAISSEGGVDNGVASVPLRVGLNQGGEGAAARFFIMNPMARAGGIFEVAQSQEGQSAEKNPQGIDDPESPIQKLSQIHQNL